MAHLLANNPGQQDAGEILLSGFTHMALQMEAQRRLMKPGSKPRRGKKGPKKQPQRGLGVAQLEKIRLEEQRRASQHAQQLAALRQLHSAPPLFSSSTAGMRAPAACIIPQLEREINHASMLHMPPSMSSSLAHFPCIDTISSSFLLNNVSAALSSTVRPTMHPSASATPLDLFPTHKLGAPSSIKVPDHKNWSLQQLRHDNRGFLENPHSSLDLAYDQNNEGHDHGSLNYSLLHMRRNCVPIAELRNSGQTNQVPNRMASPSFSLDRMVELSSFQSATASSTGDQLVFPKRQAWGAAQQPGGELPIWAIPSLAHSKTSHEHGIHYRRSEEECELTLRPPGGGSNVSVKGDQLRANEVPTSCSRAGRGPHNFLSLSVQGGATYSWEDSVADASSSTPSPTTTTTTSTTDEYTSPLATCMPRPTNFLSLKNYLMNESQNSLLSTCDVNLDLTLKL